MSDTTSTELDIIIDEIRIPIANTLYGLPDYERDDLKQAIEAYVAQRAEVLLKSGFYAGQAMARVELEDCHKNWKKWNLPNNIGGEDA